ncbi:MAG: hypothetical protein FJ291_24405 [Planctomycetes bacterium]|nr:hypothetical protein [Planctomycetota bacterium]
MTIGRRSTVDEPHEAMGLHVWRGAPCDRGGRGRRAGPSAGPRGAARGHRQGADPGGRQGRVRMVAARWPGADSEH